MRDPIEQTTSIGERLTAANRELKITRMIALAAFALLFFSVYQWNKQAESARFWIKECVNSWGQR